MVTNGMKFNKFSVTNKLGSHSVKWVGQNRKEVYNILETGDCLYVIHNFTN